MKRLPLISAVLLLAISAICCGKEGVPPLSSADIVPLKVALEDFSKRPDSVQYNRDNPHAHVAIGPQTESAADRTYNGMYYSFVAEELPSAGKSLVANLLLRNRECYVTKQLDLPELGLRVDNQGVEEDLLETRHSAVRTYVHVKAPGYSSDGHYALVWFQFRWSMHGAYAMYLLARDGDAWVIRAYAFRYLV